MGTGKVERERKKVKVVSIIEYPGLLFCSEAARKATHTFLTLLAPMLELLPIN